MHDSFRTPTENTRIANFRPLWAPAYLVEQHPVSPSAQAFVRSARGDIEAVLRGQDDRLVCVVGPCSIHDVEAAKEYASRLKTASSRWEDALVVVMRVYFEKPRTTVGWKGLINDPRLDGTFRVNEGLTLARSLLVYLIEQGVRVGCEYLDTITPQYIADTVSWGAIGARTTESQVHRELASGMSMPIGFKNGTDGNVRVAVEAVTAALHPHCLLSVGKQGIAAIVETTGNPDAHIILRGGQGGPNASAASVKEACELLKAAGLPERVMVDCSHANSGRVPQRQAELALELAQRLAKGEREIFGVMIESHLLEGRQDFVPGAKLVYGKSITDPCIGWDTTVTVLDQLAEGVRGRRAVTGRR